MVRPTGCTAQDAQGPRQVVVKNEEAFQESAVLRLKTMFLTPNNQFQSEIIQVF
jgi:hypothetical protein